MTADEVVLVDAEQLDQGVVDLHDLAGIVELQRGDGHADGGVVEGTAEPLLRFVPLGDVFHQRRVVAGVADVVEDDTHVTAGPDHPAVGGDEAGSHGRTA